MISKDTYTVLKKIPRFPKTTTINELHTKLNMDISLLVSIVEDSISCDYITAKGRNPNRHISELSIFLIEPGQIAIEEYIRNKNSATKSTWALIVAGLSFIVSIIALFVR